MPKNQESIKNQRVLQPIKNQEESSYLDKTTVEQVMTIADLRPFVIVEKQHVPFFDFGLWQNVLSKFLLFQRKFSIQQFS